MDEGETVMPAVVAPPGLHTYDDAPLAVSVVDWPLQIVVDVVLIDTVMVDVTVAVTGVRLLFDTRSEDFTTRS